MCVTGKTATYASPEVTDGVSAALRLGLVWAAGARPEGKPPLEALRKSEARAGGGCYWCPRRSLIPGGSAQLSSRFGAARGLPGLEMRLPANLRGIMRFADPKDPLCSSRCSREPRHGGQEQLPAWSSVALSSGSDSCKLIRGRKRLWRM